MASTRCSSHSGSRTRSSEAGRLEVGDVRRLVAAVGDRQVGVDDRLGGQPRHRRRADVLERQHPVAERGADDVGERSRTSAGQPSSYGTTSTGRDWPADADLRDLVEVGELEGTPERVSGHPAHSEPSQDRRGVLALEEQQRLLRVVHGRGRAPGRPRRSGRRPRGRGGSGSRRSRACPRSSASRWPARAPTRRRRTCRAPRLAIWLESSAWSAARKLTQNLPERWIAGQAREVLAGMNSTSGGLSETDENDWQVRPTGAPPLIAVTTVTPEANRPSTSRNWRAAATASGSSASTKVSSPGRNWKSYIESPSQDSIRSWLGQVSRASGSSPRGRRRRGSCCAHAVHGRCYCPPPKS